MESLKNCRFDRESKGGNPKSYFSKGFRNSCWKRGRTVTESMVRTVTKKYFFSSNCMCSGG